MAVAAAITNTHATFAEKYCDTASYGKNTCPSFDRYRKSGCVPWTWIE